jgi:hypothetical protein
VTLGTDPDSFAAFVTERREAMGRLVKEASITIE